MLAFILLLISYCQFTVSKTVKYDWSIDWVTASPDGFTRPVIGINGQWPCPQVDVDLGDRLIVTIHNNLGNESTGLHWHGINQYGHATMDGSAGVAQCPVPPNSSFTYDFPVCWIDCYEDGDTNLRYRSINQVHTGIIRTPRANIPMDFEDRSLFTTQIFPIISTKKLP